MSAFYAMLSSEDAHCEELVKKDIPGKSCYIGLDKIWIKDINSKYTY